MEAPNDYKTAGIFILVSGILNTMTAAFLVLGLIWFCIGVLWIPVIVFGIMEIVTGVSMMQGQPRHNSQITSALGLVGGLLTGNMISLVLEILALVFVGKPEVKGWLEQH